MKIVVREIVFVDKMITLDQFVINKVPPHPSKLAKHKAVVKIPTIILRSTHLWPHHLIENIFLNLSIVCLFRLLVPPRENISRPEGGTVAKAKPSHNSNTSILVERAG